MVLDWLLPSESQAPSVEDTEPADESVQANVTPAVISSTSHVSTTSAPDNTSRWVMEMSEEREGN